MKSYFPFTDYDFYAYLTSGGLMLAVLDYTTNESQYLSQSSWTFVQIAVAVAAAYVLGHIVAMLAQAILETVVVSRMLSKPIALQLAFSEPNSLEKVIGFLVGRYYSPLPEGTRASILEAAAKELGKPVDEITDPEDVFLVGFRKSFASESTRQRIDSFRNQYGFCRNISFVALIATGLLAGSAWCSGNNADWYAAMGAILVFVAMFIRFVKFLSAFQAEVVRTI